MASRLDQAMRGERERRGGEGEKRGKRLPKERGPGESAEMAGYIGMKAHS